MECLELIDDIRNYAKKLMTLDSNLDYAEATKRAKIAIVGHEIKITDYTNEKEKLEDEIIGDASYKNLVIKELNGAIKVDLYSESQLKEILISKRMGVNIENFINIFFTPSQIRFITLISVAGEDITPYVTNLSFDPDEEMKKISSDETGSEELESDKVYRLDKAS